MVCGFCVSFLPLKGHVSLAKMCQARYRWNSVWLPYEALYIGISGSKPVPAEQVTTITELKTYHPSNFCQQTLRYRHC